MAKFFPAVSAFGWWPSPAQAPTGTGPAVRVRGLLVTILSAFFVVALAAWSLGVMSATFSTGAADLAGSGPVAFQPSQFIRTELSAGYLSR